MENQTPIEEIQEWTVTLTESVSRVATELLEHVPEILGAVVLVFTGWGVAWLLRYATVKIAEKTLVRLAHTRPMDTRVTQPRSYSTAPTIAGRIVFWLVLLFFVLAAAEVLNLELVSGVLSAVTGYIPRLLAGLLIIVIGLWFAEVTRAVLKRTGIKMGIEQSDVFGRMGQILVLLIVFAIAAGQIGIDNTLLVALVAILVGVIFGAIALAFSLGAQTTIANLLAARSIAQIYSAGDHIRIGDAEGKILHITRTSLVLQTDEGQILIPAKRFNEIESVQISGGKSA